MLSNSPRDAGGHGGMDTQHIALDPVLVSLVTASSIATLLLDSSGTIRVSNEAAEHLLAGQSDSLNGFALSKFCSPGNQLSMPGSVSWCTLAGGRRALRQVSTIISPNTGATFYLCIFRKTAHEETVPLGDELQDAILEIGRVPEIASGDFQTASKRLVRLVSDVLRVDRVSLWLLVEGNTAIECIALFERRANRHSSGARLLNADYPKYFAAFESGRVIAANDALTDPRTAEFAVGYLDVLGIGSMLDSIIRVSGEVLGVVCHEHVGGPRQWTESETIFASEVADLAAHAYLAGKHRETEVARSRLEAELAQSQKLEAVGRLAGGVAHDFNNLLSIVMGHAEIARAGGESVVSESLDKIQEAASRAATLTSQLLSIGRRQVLQKGIVDLSGLVGDVLKLLRSVIPENIAVRFEPGEVRASIVADPGQLEQAVLNLCLNARDAIPSGGTIQITTRLDRHLNDGQPWVVVSISDDGIGMAREEMDRVFEPFYSTKVDRGGTGLGLSMVYGIARQHEGYVEVSSELGVGTTFEMRFPQSEQPAGSEQAVQSWGTTDLKSERNWGAGYHVLIAEDCPSIRSLYTQILETTGLGVSSSSDGKEAYLFIQNNPGKIDLVMMDVIMPEMNGPEAARRIRAIQPGIPIIFNTGYGADALSPEDLAAAHTYVLNKPSTANSIFQTIRKALGIQTPGATGRS